jgi:hypothetical protein
MPPEPPRRLSGPRFDVEISPELEGGVYADFASLWHTPDAFVIDFAALRHRPYVESDRSTGEETAVAPTRVVARIKIPPRQVWELMRALEKELTEWEDETGLKVPPPV